MSTIYSNNILPAAWTVPPTVHAFSTTRHFPELTESTLVNLKEGLPEPYQSIPNDPLWLKQAHTALVITPEEHLLNQIADGSYSDQANTLIVIKTADCLPIFITNQSGTEIAALHAGWRGLGRGIIENSLKHFQSAPEELIIYFGPAISHQYFEVGQDVFDCYLHYHEYLKAAFKTHPHKANHYFLNLIQAATLVFKSYGVLSFFDSGFCTYGDPDRFYSYRRGQDIGRLYHFIWFTGHSAPTTFCAELC